MVLFFNLSVVANINEGKQLSLQIVENWTKLNQITDKTYLYIELVNAKYCGKKKVLICIKLHKFKSKEAILDLAVKKQAAWCSSGLLSFLEKPTIKWLHLLLCFLSFRPQTLRKETIELQFSRTVEKIQFQFFFLK